MTLALVYAIGLLVGAAVVWVAHRDELRYLRSELSIAQDRLLHAWKDDAKIPPRPVEPAPPVQPLPKALADEVAQWESPESRRTMEQKIRGMWERGMEPAAILMRLDDEHPA